MSLDEAITEFLWLRLLIGGDPINYNWKNLTWSYILNKWDMDSCWFCTKRGQDTLVDGTASCHYTLEMGIEPNPNRTNCSYLADRTEPNPNYAALVRFMKIMYCAIN